MSPPAANTRASFASTKKNPPAPGGAIENPTEQGGATPTPAGRGGATTTSNASKPPGPGLLKHPPEGTYVDVVHSRQQVTPLGDAIVALSTTTPRPGRYYTGSDDKDNGTSCPPSPPCPDRDTGSNDNDLGYDDGFTQLSEASRDLLTPPPVNNEIHPTTLPPPAADGPATLPDTPQLVLTCGTLIAELTADIAENPATVQLAQGTTLTDMILALRNDMEESHRRFDRAIDETRASYNTTGAQMKQLLNAVSTLVSKDDLPAAIDAALPSAMSGPIATLVQNEFSSAIKIAISVGMPNIVRDQVSASVECLHTHIDTLVERLQLLINTITQRNNSNSSSIGHVTNTTIPALTKTVNDMRGAIDDIRGSIANIRHRIDTPAVECPTRTLDSDNRLPAISPGDPTTTNNTTTNNAGINVDESAPAATRTANPTPIDTTHPSDGNTPFRHDTQLAGIVDDPISNSCDGYQRMRDLNPDGAPTATTHLPHHNWTDTHATNPRPLPACTPDLRGIKSVPRGGPILSPRNMDRKRHARQLGASRFDIASLAHASYHAGHYGAPRITASFLQDCGYTNITSDDVVTCFNDIVSAHERIYQL